MFFFIILGISVLGPKETVSFHRYNLKKCVFGVFNHRLNLFVKDVNSNLRNINKFKLDCSLLRKRFPFRNRTSGVITNGKTEIAPIDEKIENNLRTIYIKV